MRTRQNEKIFKPGPLRGACHAPARRQLKPVILFKNKQVTLYSFEIGARQWKKISEQQFVSDIVIQDITTKVLKNQGITVFLDGNIDVVKLPFVLYQQCVPLKLCATLKHKKIIISLQGRFVINVHSTLVFKAFVFHGKFFEELKSADINDYGKICLAFGIKQ